MSEEDGVGFQVVEPFDFGSRGLGCSCDATEGIPFLDRDNGDIGGCGRRRRGFLVDFAGDDFAEVFELVFAGFAFVVDGVAELCHPIAPFLIDVGRALVHVIEQGLELLDLGILAEVVLFETDDTRGKQLLLLAEGIEICAEGCQLAVCLGRCGLLNQVADHHALWWRFLGLLVGTSPLSEDGFRFTPVCATADHQYKTTSKCTEFCWFHSVLLSVSCLLEFKTTTNRLYYIVILQKFHTDSDNKRAFQVKNNIMEQSLVDVVEALDGGVQPSPSDKLLHNLLLCIYRHALSIDWLIEARRTGRVKRRTRNLLAWAMAEMLWMDGVAPEAVTDVVVGYAKKRHSSSEGAFVNAFLRRLLEDYRKVGIDGLLKEAPPNVRSEIPDLLWKRWLKQYGTEESARIADVLQMSAQTILRLRNWPPQELVVPDWLVPVETPAWAPWAVLFTPQDAKNGLDEVMGVERCPFYIQDMATLLAPTMLSPQEGESVADLCAAPGGKSLVLGEMLKGTGRLFCADKSEAKLPRLKRNLWSIPNVEFVALDAGSYAFQEATFDAVLLDVPCSNTGVIRRKPDVREAFTLQRLNEVMEIQRRILDNVAHTVKPGGRLVYSTCSIEADENQLQVQKFLAHHADFTLVREQALLPAPDHDGAYAALLRRKTAS